MPEQRNDAPDFWSFLREYGNPNHPGQGVDRHQDNWDFDMSAFPSGQDPNSGPRQGHAPGPWVQAPGGWGGFFSPDGAWSPWDEPENHHRHGGRRNHEDHTRGRGHAHGRHERHDGEKGQEHEHPGGPQTPDDDMEELNEKDQSPETMQANEDNSDPEEVVLEENDGDDNNNNGAYRGRCHPGRNHRRGRDGHFRHGGFGGLRGGFGYRRGGRHGHFRGPIPHHGPGAHHGPPQPPFPFPFGPAPPHHGHGPGNGNQWAGMMRGFVNHPLFQAFRDHFLSNDNNANGGPGNNDRSAEDNVFVPPADTFSTPTHYVLHIALPGAKKDDIAVNWSPDRSALQISGIVHRPGDEELISALASSERKVGMFQKEIKLPPPGVEDDSGEVDADGISAKMEDGVLMIMVPKVEREWTEVKRVDIE